MAHVYLKLPSEYRESYRQSHLTDADVYGWGRSVRSIAY